MAADLAGTRWPAPVPSCAATPTCRLRRVRLPERRLVFDLNDFDETLPGPFEYDVKRMAASFVIAGRTTGSPEPTPAPRRSRR